MSDMPDSKETDGVNTQRFNTGEKLAHFIFISGLIYPILFGLKYILLLVVVYIFLLMLAVGSSLNTQLRSKGVINAKPVFLLGIGGIVIFGNIIIYMQISSNFTVLFSILVASLIACVYEYIYLTIIRHQLSEIPIYVQQHPNEINGPYYIFLENTYIPLVEKVALDNQSES